LFASTDRLQDGEVQKTPKHNWSAWFCTGSSICKEETRAEPYTTQQ